MKDYWYAKERSTILGGLVYWRREKNVEFRDTYRLTVGVLWFIPVYRKVTR